ncbi:MAG: hypothetical protein AB7F31_04440 [Parachlamydiales bacterium]
MYARLAIGAVGLGVTSALAHQAYKAESEKGQALWGVSAMFSAVGTMVTLIIMVANRNYALDLGGGKSLSLHWATRSIDLKDLTALTDNHLQALAQYPELRSLRLENCPLITREGLNRLGEQCPALHTLTVKNCPEIGVWGEEAISPGLIDNLVRHYEAQFSPVTYVQEKTWDGYIIWEIYHKRCVAEHTCAIVEHLGKTFTWTREAVEWR